ncbi:Alpha/Beta hydrolase protein [Globomyces pollinis-pini]|nr:Alpha/Beta hydrolase protein [Globomyces pollinis-pini]
MSSQPFYNLYPNHSYSYTYLVLKRWVILLPRIVLAILSHLIFGPKIQDWDLLYQITVISAICWDQFGGSNIQQKQQAAHIALLPTPSKCKIVKSKFKRDQKVIDYLSQLPSDHAPHAKNADERVYGEWIQSDTLTVADEDHVIYYLHGGGYYTGSIEVYKTLLYHLSKTSNSKVFAIQYRLAPQNPYPCGLIDAVSGYLYLLEQGYSPNNIVISGDSAGGGLAISLCLVLRDMKLVQPAALYLICPWVDLTSSFPSFQTNAPYDIIKPHPKDQRIPNRLQYYTKDECLKESYVSPIWSKDLTNLIPMFIQTGTVERLHDEIIEFSKKVAKFNNSITLETYQSHVHDFLLMAELNDGAYQACIRAGEFIKRATLRSNPIGKDSIRVSLSFTGNEIKSERM